MGDIVKMDEHEGGSIERIIDNRATIKDVLERVLVKKVDYGTIPGCGDKFTLLKPGAEKILSVFNIAVTVKSIEDLSTGDAVKYHVILAAVSNDGRELGTGVGSCSSSETKYKWRKAVSNEEFEATRETHKRIKYGKSYNANQVRTEPADMDNTILKMAKKRAMVDLTLTVTAASDMFTQDIGDATEGNGEPKKEYKEPQKKSDNVYMSVKQAQRFYAIGAKSGFTDGEIKDKLKQYGYDSSKEIASKADYDALCDWMEAGPQDD